MKRHESAPEPEILKRVTVRLLIEPERARFDALLEQKHYLCSARMVGRTLRYVAELDGEPACVYTQTGGLRSPASARRHCI